MTGSASIERRVGRRPASVWPACRSARRSLAARWRSNRRSARARQFSCESRSMPRTPMPDKLRVLLADDHATVRHGLKLLIDGQPDMHVVAEAADGAAAIQCAQDVRPDVVV